MPTHAWGPLGSPLRRLERALEGPERAQAELLRRLVARAASTAFGREHGFAALRGAPDIVAAYQHRVPLRDHGALAPYVNRVRRGEPNVLWPGRTTAFAVSGGTESGGRVVPISREGMRRFVGAALAPGFTYLARYGRRADFLGGRILSVPGGVKLGEFGPGTITGEVSGLLAYHAPAILAAWLQALPRSTMLLEDWNRKLEEAARIAARRDVRAIVMVPSWTPALLDRIRDQAGWASTVEAVHAVWPRLRVFFSGGVALSGYREILRSRLGPDVALVESYSASEGFFAFQDDPGATDLVLHLASGVFYEFVPMEERGRASPSRHAIGSVATGVDYTLFVTNASGLFGCAVEDVVRFTSLHPPRIRVVGRAREVLDRFGEAMGREHVEDARSEADSAHGSLSLHVHVSYARMEGSDLPRHHWLLEFDVPPRDAAAYAASLDAALHRLNGRYRKRREPGVLLPPSLTVLPSGSVRRYLETARSRLGPQSKLPLLSEDRGAADALIDCARGIDPAGPVDIPCAEPARRA